MHAERVRLKPYPLPDLALPAQAEWQAAVSGARSASGADAAASSASLARLARDHQAEIERFESSLVSANAFTSWLTRFAAEAGSIAQPAEADQIHLTATPFTLIIDETDRRGASHAIYDQFFRVTRNPGLSAVHVCASILASYERALLDFPYATIARNELYMLLRAMTRSIAIMAGDISTELPNTRLDQREQLPSVVGRARELADAWSHSDADPNWLTHVADHRWLSGHHLFFLFANFARVSLDRAGQALAAERHKDIAQPVRDAGLFYRALASAMWYASDFPPSLYRSHTRAWMSTAGAANGFSGSDNIDYADLRRSRTATVNALFAAYGADAAAWPEDVERAFRSFHEMEIQHAEHHVQIAARAVGTDTSLVQKRMTRTVYNAVDVLRDMVVEEWEELSRRFA
jgi:hypothetical protein